MLKSSPGRRLHCERTSSATVLQTFAFLNGGFVIEESRQVARRVFAEAEGDAARVDRAYGLVLSRVPTDAERSSTLQFIQDQIANYTAAGQPADQAVERAWAELCHVLLCTNEFLYVE